ncbi:MAG TPA: oxygenase MpaB family protein [Nocardioides sp.]
MSRPGPTALPGAEQAVARYGAFGQAWLDGMWQADPLGDAVAADRAASKAVRTLMTEGLGALEDRPASVTALIEAVTTDPVWLDRERLDHAADVLVRYSAQWGLVLGAASLLAGAENWIAAKPLLLTGRYGNQPAVRSIEVGEWLSAVVRRGGMAIDAPGFTHTVRVRMIHAHVRRFIGRGDEWDEAAWGVPIPQPYMAFTLAEFGHISLAAMEKLGVDLRRDELDSIYHLWRYVGHLIGVDPALAPVTEADHIRIEDLYRITSPGPDDFARDFTRALTEDYLAPQFAGLLLGPLGFRTAVSRGLVYGMSRVFLGDRVADQLSVPDGPAKHVLRVARPGLRLLDRARHGLLGAERLTAAGYAARDEALVRMKAEQGMGHDMVDSVPGAVGGTA